MGASGCKQNGKCGGGDLPTGHLLCVCQLAFLPSKPWVMKRLGPSFLYSTKWPKVLVNKLRVRKTSRRMLQPGIYGQPVPQRNVTYIIYILLDLLAKVLGTVKGAFWMVNFRIHYGILPSTYWRHQAQGIPQPGLQKASSGFHTLYGRS